MICVVLTAIPPLYAAGVQEWIPEIVERAQKLKVNAGHEPGTDIGESLGFNCVYGGTYMYVRFLMCSVDVWLLGVRVESCLCAIAEAARCP